MRNLNPKSRVFCAILYPKENEKHEQILCDIIQKYDCAYINHDKDKKEDGEQKKEHTHIVFRIGSNPRYKEAVAEELEIEEHLIDACNLEKMLRYLIHYDNPEKYKYSIEEVQGNLKQKLVKMIMKLEKDEEQEMGEIIEEIEKRNIKNIGLLIKWGINNGYYETIRKNQYIIVKIIDERRLKKWA